MRAVDPSRYVVYVGFFLILVGFSIVLRDDGFLTARNLLNIVQQTAPVTVMAVGMVFVLTAGEIDLSIGSIVGDLGAARGDGAARPSPGSLGAAAGLAAGAAIGAINGALVAYLRLPSFLVTLATMGLLAGVARWLTNLQSVPITNDDVQQPVRRGHAVRRAVAGDLDGRGRSPSGTSSIARARFGAHVHAIGDNARRRPRRRHPASTRVRFAVMVLSGVMAGARRPALCRPAARRALYARRDRPAHRHRRGHRRRHAAHRRHRHGRRRADRLAADGHAQQRPDPDGARRVRAR